MKPDNSDVGAAAQADAAALQAALRQSGAMQEGHFRLTSGRHSDRFFLLSLLFQHPDLAEPVAAALSRQLQKFAAPTVIGPAMGGVLLAYSVARHLGLRALYTEKVPAAADGGGGAMALRRGFQLTPGEPVLMVEDVLTTGGSLKAAMAAVTEAGGRIVGAGVLIDRSGGRVDVGVPMTTLWQTVVGDWEPADCVLCRQGVPLTRPKAGGPGAAGN